MRDDSAGFRDANGQPNKWPRITIELAFDNDATDLLYLTNLDDTEAPPAAITAGEVIYGVVRGIGGQSQSIDPINAVATIGGFSFEVVDYDESFTVYVRDKLANGDGLRHKRIRAFIGFEGMAWDNYSTILTYIIDGITYRDGIYKINCSDIQREARQDIFDPNETYLSATITATATLIPCIETTLTKFKAIAHDAAYSDRPSAYVGYARIEDEIFSHSGLTNDSALGPSFVVLQRGALNTRATEHVLDATAATERRIKIKEHIYLEGPAPKIMYALLTGNLYNQFDASSPPVQETLPDNWHLGIATSFVRLSDLTGIGVDLWDTTNLTGRKVRISGPKKGDGKKFIERELLLWLGCFMPVYASGELGLRRLSPVLSDSGYITILDESNVRSYGDLNHAYSDVINQILIDWNHIYLKDEYTKTSYLLDAGSIAKHNKAPIKNLELFAVHTGAHTDEDIASYFDTMRDRYSGPPLRIQVTVMPSLNWLEVGDTVRLDLDQIRDFNEASATKIDRVFEVQRVQTDWITGKVTLDLFGSSQKAGTLSKTALSSVLDDAFYSSAGTELSTVLTISGGAVTANGSLTGGSTMAAGIYYYLGDLTINAGLTVTLSDNVQLRVMGALTINGTLDGAGNGLSGGAGATLWSNGLTTITTSADAAPTHNAGIGAAGFLGSTVPCGNNPETYLNTNGFYTADPIVRGAAAVPFFNIRNQSTTLDGIPTDLRGTAGSGGGAVSTGATSGGNTLRTLRVEGTAGGDGGAGLVIISRGMSFGASGNIDLSGNDAPINTGSYTLGGFEYPGSPGAGGAPGGFALFIDGQHTPPELTDELTSLHGDSPFQGDRSLSTNDPQGQFIYAPLVGLASFDMGSSAYTVQFIPESSTVEEENDPPPPDVTGFTVGLSGSTVVFRWLEVSDNNLEGYEVRYSAQTVNAWDSALPLTRAAAGTRITDTAIRDGDWRFYIKARDANGQYSQNAASYDATVVSDFDIIESNNEHPDWLGTKTNFVKHWTGKLIPQSQDADSTDDGALDEPVPNPYPTCTYETSELDVTFDDTIRASIETLGELFPTETGAVAITNYIDYKLAAGSYDGFETWESGEVEARYIKFKFELDTTQGVAFIDSCQIIADLIERAETAQNVAVSASGESIVFTQAFHVAPAVRADMVGGGAVFPTVSNVTTTGFDIDCYNTSGTGVSGTINWRAEGV